MNNRELDGKLKVEGHVALPLNNIITMAQFLQD